jgi:galactofuranose transport system ATP-binding protein
VSDGQSQERLEYGSGNTSAAVLQAVSVSKNFDRVQALADVSFDVEPGEVHAIAGQNGAGKSTLIKILTGYHLPDGGELRLAGQPVQLASPRAAQQAGIAAMYQEVNLIPQRSVASNLLMGREPRGRLGLIDVRAMHRQARELMARYGFRDIDVTAEVASYPLGIQQMVALVRSAAISSRVLIMDEPTSALNAAEVQTLSAVVRRLADEGSGIVFVSHRLDELYQLCSRVTVLRDGRVAESSAMADITRPALVAAMLGRELLTVTEKAKAAASNVGAEVVLETVGLSRGVKVRDVSLAVHAGEVVGLAGLLGSGRTETVETIFGIETADAGRVEVAGRRLRAGSPRSAIAAGLAFLPEDRRADGIIPNMSIRDNIALAVMGRTSRLGFINNRRIDQTVRELMQRLSVRAYGPEQKISELSGGNQQKVLLARWLATEPKAIFLDDPTRGIDVGAKAEVEAIIAELARGGVGVIAISSEIEVVVAVSDRVLVLDSGRLAGELGPGEVDEDHVLGLLAGKETP